ncbi:hypothetical protein WG66_014385 [Moniliophthora roreri]|nr:hypothetical protein WG66_014385 [Moniliophthora roreri]
MAGYTTEASLSGINAMQAVQKTFVILDIFVLDTDAQSLNIFFECKIEHGKMAGSFIHQT